MTSSGADVSSMKEHIVLILVGLVGSGKSTFAEALQEHFPEFRRCNQDDLGRRQQVEALARDSLAKGFSVCIDRTNFNESQRRYWIDIAYEFPQTAIWVIVFDTPYEVCATRLQQRTWHPTIKSPEEGLSILARFASDLRLPNPSEGYHRLLTLKPSDHTSSVYARSDIANILERLRHSPLVTSTPVSTWHGASGWPRGSRSSPRYFNRGMGGGKFIGYGSRGNLGVFASEGARPTFATIPGPFTRNDHGDKRADPTAAHEWSPSAQD